MERKMSLWGVSFICFLYSGVTFGQNPILRSSTTGAPPLMGTTSSIITQNGNFIGIGTTTPTQRLTIKSHNETINGEFQTISPTIRLEHADVLGLNYTWHLSGGPGFQIQNISSGKVPLIIATYGDVNLMQKLQLNVQGLTDPQNNKLSFEASSATVRRISWSSYLNTTNNTQVPLEFLYDAQGGGAVDVSVMKLMPTGQVRIGNPNTLYQSFVLGSAANTNSSIRLTVDGNVAAKGFIATQQNWADFVFYAPESNPTLREEEISIQKNCTLVGVPTETEVALGRNLADNDALLLQKVEQLYLHVIELNKKVETLTRENEAMKLRLDEK